MRQSDLIRNILVLAAVLLSGAAYAQMQATPEMTAEQAAANQIYRAGTDAAVTNLLDTIDLTVAPEPPRTGLDARGHLDFFGAPPGMPAPLIASAANARTAEDQAVAFITDNAAAFGIHGENVGLLNVRENVEAGRTYLRFQQTYADLEVFGAEIIVQLENGGVAAVFSDIMTDTWKLDTNPLAAKDEITLEDAVVLAIDSLSQVLEQETQTALANLELHLKAGDLTDEEYGRSAGSIVMTRLVSSPDSKLVFYDPAVVGESGEPRLCWLLEIASAPSLLISEQVFVDAKTGEVAERISLIHSAKNRQVYDADYSTSTVEPPTVLMRQETDPALTIFDSFCCWLSFNRNFDGFGQAFDYYWNNFGWDSFNGGGATIKSYMYWYSEINAFYSGALQGSFHFGNLGVDNADDVIGHEFTHGVTRNTSNLVYENESGAINESLSDVFGEFIDLTMGGWSYDDPADKWRVAEDVVSGSWRYMKNPPLRGSFLDGVYHQHPDRYNSPNFYLGSDDRGGVHVNSGVNNKLCYLLTDGETFNGYVVAGMGMNTVRDLYWECQTNLLTRASDYTHLYFTLTQAAINLGLSQSDRTNIESACKAVEIATDDPVFTVNDPDGVGLLQFRSDGNMVIFEGRLFENASQTSLTPNAQIPEFVIRRGSTYLARLRSDTGDLYIKGSLFENQTSLATTSKKELVIRAAGQVVAIVDQDGHLRLRGQRWDFQNPH